MKGCGFLTFDSEGDAGSAARGLEGFPWPTSGDVKCWSVRPFYMYGNHVDEGMSMTRDRERGRGRHSSPGLRASLPYIHTSFNTEKRDSRKQAKRRAHRPRQRMNQPTVGRILRPPEDRECAFAQPESQAVRALSGEHENCGNQHSRIVESETEESIGVPVQLDISKCEPDRGQSEGSPLMFGAYKTLRLRLQKLRDAKLNYLESNSAAATTSTSASSEYMLASERMVAHSLGHGDVKTLIAAECLHLRAAAAYARERDAATESTRKSSCACASLSASLSPREAAGARREIHKALPDAGIYLEDALRPLRLLLENIGNCESTNTEQFACNQTLPLQQQQRLAENLSLCTDIHVSTHSRFF
jgi:hypothetical protein